MVVQLHAFLFPTSYNTSNGSFMLWHAFSRRIQRYCITHTQLGGSKAFLGVLENRERSCPWWELNRVSSIIQPVTQSLYWLICLNDCIHLVVSIGTLRLPQDSTQLQMPQCSSQSSQQPATETYSQARVPHHTSCKIYFKSIPIIPSTTRVCKLSSDFTIKPLLISCISYGPAISFSFITIPSGWFCCQYDDIQLLKVQKNLKTEKL